MFGAFSGGATPVLIPNTEVKPARADGSDTAGYRESRSVPDIFKPYLSQGSAERDARHFQP